MSQFAIFYEPGDLQVMQLYTKDNIALIPQADQQLATKFWNGGLKNWNTALLGQSPFEQFNPNSTSRIVVMNVNGQTLLDFRNLLYRIATAIPGAGYLKALADDMGGASGAVEPWPVA